MGYKKEHVEVFDKPITLKNYSGNNSNFKAEIRIKGAGWRNENHVGGYKNDLGFEKSQDGTFIMHVDGHDKNWQTKLQQQYSREVIKEIAADKGFFIEEDSEVDGEIFLRIQSPF